MPGMTTQPPAFRLVILHLVRPALETMMVHLVGLSWEFGATGFKTPAIAIISPRTETKLWS